MQGGVDMNPISQALREFLKDEEIEIFDNTQYQFSSLEDDEEIIVVLNYFGDENLYMQTGEGQAVLAFGQWRKTYDDSYEDIELLKDDIAQIMTNNSYVWTIIDSRNCIVGYVDHHGVQYLESTNELGWAYRSSNEFLKTIAADEGSQNFLFWDPALNNAVQPSQFLI